MPRGKWYTDEENAKLEAVIEDNKDLKLVEIADKAQKYGICSERSRDALAGHIGDLRKAMYDEDDEEDENDDYALVLVYEQMYRDVRAKYERACDAIIGSATLFEDNPNILKLNFSAIRDWIKEEEPQRMLARIEALRNKED